jgi:hypothetical protein
MGWVKMIEDELLPTKKEFVRPARRRLVLVFLLMCGGLMLQDYWHKGKGLECHVGMNIEKGAHDYGFHVRDVGNRRVRADRASYNLLWEISHPNAKEYPEPTKIASQYGFKTLKAAREAALKWMEENP